MGMRPILCAKFSSGMMEVFCHMLTFSIAIVGISAMRILLKALARGGSTPTKSNTISSSSSFWISMSQVSMKFLRLTLSSYLVVPVNEAGCSKVDVYDHVKYTS